MKFKKFIFKKVISTNLTAINLLKKSQLNYGMITADLQTKGKGQYGRKWISIKEHKRELKRVKMQNQS